MHPHGMFRFVAINIIIDYVLEWFHIADLRRKVFIELVTEEDNAYSSMRYIHRLYRVSGFELCGREGIIDVTNIDADIRIFENGWVLCPCVLSTAAKALQENERDQRQKITYR